MRIPSLPAFLILIAALFALPSCTRYERSSLPLAISPDGTSVAYYVSPPTSYFRPTLNTLRVVDLPSGSSKEIFLPTDQDVPQVVWVDNHHLLASPTLLDTSTGKKTSFASPGYPFYPPFVTRFQNQPALVVEGDLFALPSAAKLTQLSPYLRGVGQGYMIQFHFPNETNLIQTSPGPVNPTRNPDGSQTWNRAQLSSLTLLDPDLHPVMELSADQLTAALQRPQCDPEAQLSPDRKQLLIAPQHHGPSAGAWGPDSFIHTYYGNLAVFDVPSATLLFDIFRNALVQPAVLASDGVYGLEEIIPPPPRQPTRADHQIWLSRFDAEGRHPILQLPILADKSFSSTASPDGTFMVVHSYDPQEHLLVFPLKATLTPADIRQISLQNR